MYYPVDQFSFSNALRENWRQIRAEFDAIQSQLMDWFERELYGEGWQVYGLFDFPHGAPIQQNVGACPLTSALIQSHIPKHGAAGFSVLRPNTRIQPHVGYAGDFLRCHLGLYVPPGDCALRVAGEVHKWQEGELLIFDDRLLHDAWNLTDQDRVVLLIDFVPDLTLLQSPQT